MCMARLILSTRVYASAIAATAVTTATSSALGVEGRLVPTGCANAALMAGGDNFVNDLDVPGQMRRIARDMVLATVPHIFVTVIRAMLVLDAKTSLAQVNLLFP